MTPRIRSWPILLAIAICVNATSLQATPYDDADAALKRDDEDRALIILLPLAERGEAQAQYQVGEIYYHLKKNDRDALKWIRRATD